ncbi:4'-phosphopantetheinyl transferase family protein [Achromobacter aloeverae]|uniref:4-diphosphocytidyl-2C-methyl-D-erythritol kinase n=1 Tax=Achromobacter aloeverae TaxID=1750518 RepID=A0A4Q1HNW4_9BURK|nr:4'-phosphopantetheinyl transferase superfamily protein [Achromobacter aloeverae]RXN92732.1 4-diphosphocytidyl-2C-methyl-D-erythritol kinase [Achromobacter aloeverae]
MSEFKMEVPRDVLHSDTSSGFTLTADARGVPGLLWAGPAAAADYDAGVLSPADAARAALPRGARASLQWRVSRSALRQAGVGTQGNAQRAWSLSHSDGHALVAWAPAGWRVGVDLERRRTRDLDALAHWCCDAGERAHLATLPEAARLTFFYQLWTLKEAFIKAAELDFPADMRGVGLRAQEQGWTLRTPRGTWGARCWEIGEDWVASVAWSVAEDGKTSGPGGAADRQEARPGPERSEVASGVGGAWRVARGCALPSVRLLYATPDRQGPAGSA